MTAQIKVKVQRKAVVKFKLLPKFPSDVASGNGFIITRSGTTYTFSIDPTSLPAGIGNVVGPVGSTNNGFAKFDGTTGRLLKDHAATIALGTEVSGTLPLASGGTGGTTAATAQTGIGLREVLTADRTYYVRTDGSDSNSGLVNSAIGAFLTIQKASDTIANTIDLNKFNVTIQVVAGTYTGAITFNRPWTGTGVVTLQGDTVTPTNILLNVTGDAITVSSGCRVTVQGFKIQATSTCFNVTNGGVLNFNSMNFGASGSHMGLAYNAQIIGTGNNTISGSAGSHIHNTNASIISLGAGTWTLTGTPAFSTFFYGTSELSTGIFGCTYSGAATGTRFFIHQGSLVEGGAGVDPNAFFPGNIAGTWNGMACFNEVYPVHQMSTNAAGAIGTPSTGVGVVFIDSTSKAIVNRDDAGLLHTTVPTTTAGGLTVAQVWLGADVALNNTALYFDGPTINAGTTGTWFASGSVTVEDTGVSAAFQAKLWDGTTVIDEATHNTGAGTGRATLHLSGAIANPAANIRISVKDSSATTGFIRFNAGGNSKGATLTVMRVG